MTAFLGGGVSYRPAHRAALLGADPGPAVLEIMPEHFFAQPDALDALADRYPLIFHCVSLSIGTAVDHPLGDAVTRAYLHRVRALARRARPLFVSDHLAFTRAPNGRDLGHLCPLPYTDQTFGLVAARIRVWQDALQMPVALENIAHPFRWPHDTMTPAAFLDRLTAETGCGLLLDVTNLLYDARNFCQDAGATLRAHPLARAWSLHLAGGARGPREPFWNDTHDQSIEDEVFNLLPALRAAPQLRAAIVERDHRLPPLNDLLAEARRAADLLRAT